MNSDIATLQNIANTLEENPLASQRFLAENANMSVGLMNAVLKRFVERGWIMLTNVNLKKLSYAVTPAGIAELTARSHKFARRTFMIANKYNDTLCTLVKNAKNDGKKSVILYGSSYIKFLLEYACQTLNMNFEERQINSISPVQIEKDALCIVGEMNNEDDIKSLTKKGCTNLLELLNQEE